MSTLTLDPRAPGAETTPIPQPQQRSQAQRFVRHSLALAGRSIRKMLRTPEQFIDVTLQPIIFVVLFVYLFGGAVAGNTHDYLQLVLPAIMVQTAVFSTNAIGVNLNTDITKGVFDRFRSLPIARAAPLVGAVLGDVIRYAISIGVLFAFGYLIGFRVQTNLFQAVCAGFVGPAVLAVPVLGVRPARPGAPFAGSRTGRRVPRDVPADVRQQLLRPDVDAAQLAAGVGQHQPLDPRPRRSARAPPRRPGRRAGGADLGLGRGDRRGLRAARRPRLPPPHLRADPARGRGRPGWPVPGLPRRGSHRALGGNMSRFRLTGAVLAAALLVAVGVELGLRRRRRARAAGAPRHRDRSQARSVTRRRRRSR